MLRVAGRAVATVVALVCLYYLAPLDQPLDETKIAGLLLSIALLAVLMLLQIRAIVRSPMPRTRAPSRGRA